MADLARPTNDLCVIFCTPTLSHTVSLEFLQSILETTFLLTEAGIAMGFKQVGGDCFVAKARNRLVTEFLQEFPMASHLFFLDDDIRWPAAKVLEFLRRPEDVVAGIYPKKSDELDYPVQLQADLSTGALIERDGLVRAIGVPTGFLCIRRHVLEKMAASERKYKDSQKDGTTREYYSIFEAGVDSDGWFCGEDFAFSRKWLAMGGELWVDPNIQFSHRGGKVWCANMGNSMDVFRQRASMFKSQAA